MKKTIGKIQLAVGIILLVAGIAGIMITINYMNRLLDSTEEGLNQISNLKSQINNNETRTIFTQNVVNSMYINKFGIFNLYATLLASSIFLVLSSMLFITQGLINFSSKEQ